MFRTAIVDPSPIKQGQKVRVVWGKTKKEYTAVLTCYPVNDENKPESSKDEQQPRRAKQKLISETTQSNEPAKKGRQETQRPKKKEKPTGKILATKSPNKFYVEESESDTSDSSDDLPLASALATLQRKAVTPPPSSFPDIDDEVEDSSMGQLIANAMNTVNNMTNVCYADKQDGTSTEL